MSRKSFGPGWQEHCNSIGVDNLKRSYSQQRVPISIPSLLQKSALFWIDKYRRLCEGEKLNCRAILLCILNHLAEPYFSIIGNSVQFLRYICQENN